MKSETYTNVVLVEYDKSETPEAPVEKVSFVTHKRDKKIISQLQTELDKLTYKYNAIFNNINFRFIILDKKYKIIDFSKGIIPYMAQIDNKVLKKGVSIMDYIPAEMVQVSIDNFQRVLNGETFIIERDINFADGTSTNWTVQYTPAYSDNGKVTGIVFKVIDAKRK